MRFELPRSFYWIQASSRGERSVFRELEPEEVAVWLETDEAGLRDCISSFQVATAPGGKSQAVGLSPHPWDSQGAGREGSFEVRLRGRTSCRLRVGVTREQTDWLISLKEGRNPR